MIFGENKSVCYSGPLCEMIHNDQTKCETSTGCTWSNVTNLCASGGIDTNTIPTKLSAQQQHGSLVGGGGPMCGMHSSDQAVCKTTSGCVWLNATCSSSSGWIINNKI